MLASTSNRSLIPPATPPKTFFVTLRCSVVVSVGTSPFFTSSGWSMPSNVSSLRHGDYRGEPPSSPRSRTIGSGLSLRAIAPLPWKNWGNDSPVIRREEGRGHRDAASRGHRHAVSPASPRRRERDSRRRLWRTRDSSRRERANGPDHLLTLGARVGRRTLVVHVALAHTPSSERSTVDRAPTTRKTPRTAPSLVRSHLGRRLHHRARPPWHSEYRDLHVAVSTQPGRRDRRLAGGNARRTPTPGRTREVGAAHSNPHVAEQEEPAATCALGHRPRALR